MSQSPWYTYLPPVHPLNHPQRHRFATNIMQNIQPTLFESYDTPTLYTSFHKILNGGTWFLVCQIMWWVTQVGVNKPMKIKSSRHGMMVGGLGGCVGGWYKELAQPSHPCPATFISGKIKYIFAFSLSKSFLKEDTNPFILHSQYHDCWWPGAVHRQGISSHGIYMIIPEYSPLSATLELKQFIKSFHESSFLWLFLMSIPSSKCVQQRMITSSGVNETEKITLSRRVVVVGGRSGGWYRSLFWISHLLCRMHKRHEIQGVIAIWYLPPKLILNSNHTKTRLPITSFLVAQSISNCAQSMAVIPPCSVQNFKLIGQLQWMLRMNENLQNLSLW